MFKKIANAAVRMRSHLTVVTIQRLARQLLDAGVSSGLGAEAVLAARLLQRIAAQTAAEVVPPHDFALRKAVRDILVAQLPPEARGFVPLLEQRTAPVMSTWTFQNEVMEWDIGRDDLVLDIGSGGWPFRRANHLADRFPEGTTHRFESMVRDGRPFFEVDIEHLPFADQTYDFVFCSHVLEHLEDPAQAMRELMRVGKRGYIEVPTRLSDIMFNFTRLKDHHRWHGLRLGNTLVLIEWNQRERRELGNEFFDALQSEFTNPFQAFFERNRDLFFTSYSWEKEIEFLIIDKAGRVVNSSFSDSLSAATPAR
jgi:SAM-dependent methyltransferase